MEQHAQDRKREHTLSSSSRLLLALISAARVSFSYFASISSLFFGSTGMSGDWNQNLSLLSGSSDVHASISSPKVRFLPFSIEIVCLFSIETGAAGADWRCRRGGCGDGTTCTTPVSYLRVHVRQMGLHKTTCSASFSAASCFMMAL